MSRALALRMATDQHFGNFIEVARRRNTEGTPCRRPLLCASQPPEVRTCCIPTGPRPSAQGLVDVLVPCLTLVLRLRLGFPFVLIPHAYAHPTQTHMWHHEDAGIGYNVFRATVAANASMNYIAVPAHYNDAGIIERSAPQLSPADEYWSMRAVFVHGIKIPAHFALVKQRWNLSRPDAVFDTLNCWASNTLPRGANIHYGNWPWARVPCPQPAGVGRFCDVKPHDHFKFCSVPWHIPDTMKNRAGAKRAARRAAQEWAAWRDSQDRARRAGKRAGGVQGRRARKAIADSDPMASTAAAKGGGGRRGRHRARLAHAAASEP